MLYEELKKQKLQSFKEGDKTKSNYLGTLLSEAAKENKNPSDEEVLKTAKKFKKEAEETLEELKARNQDYSQQEKELEILEYILPKQMTSGEIEQAVQEAIRKTGAKEQKDMGKVMRELKTYGSRIDMKEASQLVRNYL